MSNTTVTPPLLTGVVHNAELDELNRTIGVVFIGYVITMVLYGFTSYQAYIFFALITGEKLWRKLTIALLTVLDTTSVGILTQVIHFYIIQEYPRSTPAVVFATKEFATDHTIGTTMIFVTQLAYAYLILPRNGPVAVIIAMFATVAFGFGFVMTSEMSGRNFNDFDHGLIKTAFAFCEGTAFLAAFISFIMLYLYQPPVKMSTSAQSRPMWYDAPIALFVEKGAVGSLILFGYFITFMAFPSARYWIPFELVARRAFSVSLVTLFINRAVLEGRTVMSVNGGLSSDTMAVSGSAPTTKFKRQNNSAQSGTTINTQTHTQKGGESYEQHKVLPISITRNEQVTRDDEYPVWSRDKERTDI